VFVPAADRWADPDAGGARRLHPACRAALPSDLGGGPHHYLDVVGHELDDAYSQATAIVAAAPGLLIDDELTGRVRLKLRRLEVLFA
jgi:hypothetical protein